MEDTMQQMRLIRVAVAAALAALAIAAIPALAGASDHGRDDHGRRHHHFHHFGGEATGTITAFDATTGKLTIAATSGDTVTGLVSGGTEIRCEGRDDFRAARRDHGDDNGGGDNSGPGSSSSNSGPGRGQAEPGDDNGGRGEPEPGDDHGEDGFENGQEGEGAAPICSLASLVPGAVVQEADVVLRGGTSFFDEIELAHPN
jgi:hypothetical protein